MSALFVLGALFAVPSLAQAQDNMPDKIAMSAVLRDFPYYGLGDPNGRTGNPYFQNELDITGPNTPIDKEGRKNSPVLNENLDGNGKPIFEGFIYGKAFQPWAGGTYDLLTRYFNEWFGKDYLGNFYTISSNYPINVGRTVAQARTDKGADGKVVKGMAYRYQWIQGSAVGDPGFPGFFPIGTTQGWQMKDVGSRRTTGYDNVSHNFCFTAEVTGKLTLPQNTEAVSVSSVGDDDLWVFINGKLITGRVLINGVREEVLSNIAYDVRPKAIFRTHPPKIVPGEDITIKIFFAERKTPGSTVRFILDVYTNDALNPDSLNVAARAEPVSEPAKIWFAPSQTQEHSFTLE